MFNIKPARSDASGPVVSDLDALDTEEVSFRLFGKVHKFKPIDTHTFFKLSNMFGKMSALSKENDLTADALLAYYADLYSCVCDTVTRDMVNKMTVQQLNGLLQLVMDHSMGKSQARQIKENSGDDYSKKKE